MKFCVDWIDSESNAVPEERATVASFKILIGNQNAAAHIIREENFDSLIGSVFGLADGVAHKWWRIFGGRDNPVRLWSFRDGYIVPDVRLTFDGQQAQIWSEDLDFHDPPCRFYKCSGIATSRADLEESLSSFIECVQRRLEEVDVKATSLHVRWSRVQESRRDAEEMAFCEAAGALDVNPYQITDEDADFIDDAAEHFGGEPLIEFLNGVRKIDRERAGKTLDVIRSVTGYKTRLADLRSIAKQIEASGPTEDAMEAWFRGYRRAADARKVIFSCGSPDVEKLSLPVNEMATWFGAGNNSYSGSKNLFGMRALRRDVGDDIHVALRSFNARSGVQDKFARRFAFARAIGDAICFPHGGTAPINELTHAYRQAAGRAFAAEFLAPITLIEEMSDGGKDIYEISEILNVSSEVINRQMDNAHNIKPAIAA